MGGGVTRGAMITSPCSWMSLHIPFGHFGYTHTYPPQNNAQSCHKNIKLLAPPWRLPKGHSIHNNKRQNIVCFKTPVGTALVSDDSVHICPIRSSQTSNCCGYSPSMGSTWRVWTFSPYAISLDSRPVSYKGSYCQGHTHTGSTLRFYTWIFFGGILLTNDPLKNQTDAEYFMEMIVNKILFFLKYKYKFALCRKV